MVDDKEIIAECTRRFAECAKREEALEICELALVLNEERGGGQNIVQCLKEALRIREWYGALPVARRKESWS